MKYNTCSLLGNLDLGKIRRRFGHLFGGHHYQDRVSITTITQSKECLMVDLDSQGKSDNRDRVLLTTDLQSRSWLLRGLHNIHPKHRTQLSFYQLMLSQYYRWIYKKDDYSNI